jgi:hypothetical protein
MKIYTTKVQIKVIYYNKKSELNGNDSLSLTEDVFLVVCISVFWCDCEM